MNNKFGVRLIVIATIFALVALIGWLWWKDALSAVDSTVSESEIFVVAPGESIRTVATKLKNQKLIKDQIGFFLLVKLTGRDQEIQAGDFRLSRSMTAEEILEGLTHGTLDVWVTLLEGWRKEEIALKLTQDLSIRESDFLPYAKEGYMFPDTYLFPKDASGSAIATILRSTFESKITQDIKNGIEAQGLTVDEGVILASIVEREGKTDVDRPMIAGILLNRLRDDWPLQVDATLQFALGYQANEKSWWKKSLYAEDKLIESPYNTYKYAGLPPGPICNPGLAALQAVAFPQESSYRYYLHDTTGQVHYAQTLDEHNQNIRQFLQ